MNNEIPGRLVAALADRYRIERKLGEGGMATVYLAEDLKHQRHVAVKVLRPELAAVVGGERFLAEIRTTASLQDPHILPLHDSGEADGFLFYVMPYVEGESLRDRLERERQLPVDEALAIAQKIAGALHYAHENGVVHRDIKPANILMSRGEPLVADFGIALALSEAGSGRITETGLSLGTPHYMSPEQAAGDRSLDKRSDVYALGCVLYEMLTGEPPHGGPTPQSVLAKILTDNPRSMTELRRSVPPHVDQAVARALEKLPADRFESAQAFAQALGDTAFQYVAPGGTGALAVEPGGAAAGHWKPVAVGLGAVAVVLALALGVTLRRPGPAAPVFRVAMELPEDEAIFTSPFGSSVVLSPDGSTMVYTGPAETGGWRLWVRRADALGATPLQGSEAAMTPVFSPDGAAVAFMASGLVKVMDIKSGTSRVVADSALQVLDWGVDEAVYYLQGPTGRVILRVPATGGEPEPVSGLVSGSVFSLYAFGDVLPGGDVGVWHVLPESGNLDGSRIVAVNLRNGDTEELATGWAPRYATSGHLLWVNPDRALMAAPFDARSRKLTGEPVAIAGDVLSGLGGDAHYSVSDGGDLVYRVGGDAGELKIVWVDRSGGVTDVDPDWGIGTPAGGFNSVTISSDGTRMAGTDNLQLGSGAQLWVRSLDAETPASRITFDGQLNARARWAPDGRLLYISNMAGIDIPTQLWTKPADGSGQPEFVFSADSEIEEALYSPDGEWLVYRLGGTIANRDIYAIRPGVDSAGAPLVATEHDERAPEISRDGRWLAYVSSETGQDEVFVRTFPDVSGGKWQVSVGGGSSPLWAHSGRELFYISNAGDMVSAALDVSGSSFRVTGRSPLFSATRMLIDINHTAFDIAPGDERFVMISLGQGEQGGVVWVRNWMEGLWR